MSHHHSHGSHAHGYAALSTKAPLQLIHFERRAPRAQDVVIDIQYCGICHSDIHQVRDEWGNAVFPMVPGHEIVGVVAAVGSGVTKFTVGQRVGVGCLVDSCQHCEQCDNGLEQFCAEQVGTYNATDKDGTRTQGGYSDHVVVDEKFVLNIPDNLPMDAAAPLLCAGITLYSPLKHWQAGPGKKVAIVGLGGLGHMGVKIAHALGAEVTVLSQTLSKEADGKRLGADHFYATSDKSTFKKLAGSFDLIINTVSMDLDWNAYLNLLKVDGTMVLLGVPEKKVPLGAFPLIMGRRSLAGSLIGGIAETQEMLDFCGKHNIVSDIEVIDIREVNEAYERVIKSDVRYRFVIDMETLKRAHGH
ncbi:MAG: NAD(P)-dependent alcohol dehydrogenase [Alphaproteobacteria bacterium]|nr:NAD(P)-dependent alcohol dehydrogenase [Alphaproteobacteria bacterium]